MSILVTRPSPFSDELVRSLRHRGRIAWAFPLIEFMPGTQLNILHEHLQALEPGDLVFILSRNVVHYAKIIFTRINASWPKILNYYAMGRNTALAFQNSSGHIAFWPQKPANSEILIQLLPLKSIEGKKALILRGNGGRNLLKDTLLRYGAQVELIECYQRCKKNYHSIEEGRRWRIKGINTLVVTSGEMLKQLYSLFSDQDREEWLLQCNLIIVSERLEILAKNLGWTNIHISSGADNKSLLNKIINCT
ncbi:uroporphyrinogen-III synthase [Candidatus Erwinia haradaeae]|uniref:Uroporphyrinogen-III synthase n=1 Tax=Candidatus Erwinia haradaeae TaxID=1922217 RepID=A0A451D2B1_9GAMM|nr:uroporphyrinogen-III synthase [Candidatus Erwinia haradaeae]VFP79773.1 Uroporphyrinogen-III synthase [Candidatus Erwinia haradaeae]